MNNLDDSLGAQAIVYLPWNDTEGKERQATWGAKIIGTTTAPPPVSSLSGPVEEALRHLTQVINLSTGLNHPSDKKHAERTIARLGQEGHLFDPVGIRRWLSGTAGHRRRLPTSKQLLASRAGKAPLRKTIGSRNCNKGIVL